MILNSEIAFLGRAPRTKDKTRPTRPPITAPEIKYIATETKVVPKRSQDPPNPKIKKIKSNPVKTIAPTIPAKNPILIVCFNAVLLFQ